MCVDTIKIYTNRHCIDYNALNPVQLEVPCGRCYQCRQKDGLEWSTRSYFEARECFKRNGFVLFDTLSYSDINLKYFEDFIPESKWTAFARYPVHDKAVMSPFFRRLRRALENDGYEVSDKLRYLYSSEYGDGEEYVDRNGKVRKGTCRPHYHILFFVTMDIEPLVFSRYVSQNWRCGLTDGVAPISIKKSCADCCVKQYCFNQCLYKSDSYVLNNRVFKEFTLESLNKILYVQKYISKESPYNRLYESRLYQLMNVVYGSTWNYSKQKRAIFNHWKRLFCCFHEQSQGFGFGLKVKQLDKEHFLDDQPTFKIDGRLQLPTFKKNMIQMRTLPKFFRRTLFMEKVKCFGGFRYKYRDDSVWFLKLMYKQQFDRMKEEFQTFMFDTSSQIRQQIKTYLNNRNIQEYFDYCIIYKGRIGQISNNKIDDYIKPKLSDDGYNVPINSCLFLYGNAFSFQYLGFPKTERFYRKFSHCCRGVKLEIKQRNYISVLEMRPREIYHGFKKVADFGVGLYPIKQLRFINEQYKQFKDFDKIDELFKTWKIVKSREKESELKERAELRCKYAKLFR